MAAPTDYPGILLGGVGVPVIDTCISIYSQLQKETDQYRSCFQLFRKSHFALEAPGEMITGCSWETISTQNNSAEARNRGYQ
jgi:hypothetical protein